jgi:hypothetical protein
MTCTFPSRAAAFALAALAFVPMTAEATIGSVTVNTSRPFEDVDDYTYAEITFHGTVARPDGSLGSYTVPAVLIFPRSGCGNGVGVVDWLNTAPYHFFPPTTEFQTIEFTRLATGQHLFEKRYTYLTIQWDKAVTEIFGPTVPPDGQPHNHLVYGTIERGADAWEILRDAARFLKDPDAYPGRAGPERVKRVLGSGYSQGGALQLELLAEGLDPTRVYDGHLVQMIGLACWKRDDSPPRFGSLGDCGPLPTGGNHARVMVLTSESDMVAFQPPFLPFGKSAFFTRNASNPRWRQYEMSGVAHIPEPVLSLLPGQNSADPRPLFRAAFDNLARWTYGQTPPAARHVEGRVDTTGAFIPGLDADGHFAGGVRLPHVESQVGGKLAGGPLGRHRPLDPVEHPLQPFVLLGGTFTCFDPAELAARYPSHLAYVKRVKRAADALADKRYIGHKDRLALIAAAAHQPFPLECDDDGNDAPAGDARASR